MTDFRLVSTTTGFQAKTVVCRGSGKTAMPGMTRALQICTVQQHLYGSSLPGSPSWCGCVPELIWETTSLGAIPMPATISNANVTWMMQATWAERAFQSIPTALCYSGFFSWALLFQILSWGIYWNRTVKHRPGLWYPREKENDTHTLKDRMKSFKREI